MYTKMQDYFYNHKGHVYGADTAGPDARIWVDFDSSPPELAEERFQYNSPENGIYLGKARYTPLDGGDVRDIIYNCHT
jgi:hypothetical protein